ncbi:hypothetical protein [Nonomuraea ceibae]|uniref:hypothetical protein n=1 Tax=Nonomuraea ceibae TaxID=1935170 RepID=UPI001C5D207E|nr:hypothetical protein [Nonomuraea ceibae]
MFDLETTGLKPAPTATAIAVITSIHAGCAAFTGCAATVPTAPPATGVVIDTDYDPPSFTRKRGCDKTGTKTVCGWKNTFTPADWDITVQYGTAKPREIPVTEAAFRSCPKGAYYPACTVGRR